jgi:hypothetical protein
MKQILLVLYISILADFNLLASDSTLIGLSGRWFWEGRGMENPNCDGNGKSFIISGRAYQKREILTKK